MEDLGGYQYYCSKCALKLAQWALDIDDEFKSNKFKIIADNIEFKKRGIIPCYNNLKKDNALRSRFNKFNDINFPPIIIYRTGSIKIDFQYINHNEDENNILESNMIKSNIDWIPYNINFNLLSIIVTQIKLNNKFKKFLKKDIEGKYTYKW